MIFALFALDTWYLLQKQFLTVLSAIIVWNANKLIITLKWFLPCLRTTLGIAKAVFLTVVAACYKSANKNCLKLVKELQTLDPRQLIQTKKGVTKVTTQTNFLFFPSYSSYKLRVYGCKLDSDETTLLFTHYPSCLEPVCLDASFAGRYFSGLVALFIKGGPWLLSKHTLEKKVLIFLLRRHPLCLESYTVPYTLWYIDDISVALTQAITTDSMPTFIARAWYGMEKKMEWNEAEILVWIMENA